MSEKKSKWLRPKAVCSLQKLVTYFSIQIHKHCFLLYKNRKISDIVHMSLDKFRKIGISYPYQIISLVQKCFDAKRQSVEAMGRRDMRSRI
jgi:hypothetical protein